MQYVDGFGATDQVDVEGQPDEQQADQRGAGRADHDIKVVPLGNCFSESIHGSILLLGRVGVSWPIVYSSSIFCCVPFNGAAR